MNLCHKNIYFLPGNDTASSFPKKKYIRTNTDYKTVENILINVCEYFFGNTRDEPQKFSNDASTNSVNSKLKKRTESFDYSQTKESEQRNANKIITNHLTELTHDLSLAQDDISKEISDDDMEEIICSPDIRKEVSSYNNNCSETEPTFARDDYVEISNCADLEITTKIQSLDKQCSQTEDNLQTNVSNIITTESNQNIFQSSINNHVQSSSTGYFNQNTPAQDDESESDDDFEKNANSKKISGDKSSDYHYTREMTNKPLKMKIKRTPVASTKTVVDSGVSNVGITVELRENLGEEINKQPQSTSTTDSIQSESPLNKSIKKSNNQIQCTKNDQNTSIFIEHNIPPRFYEDFCKLLSLTEELTKQVEKHQNLLSRATSEIEKNKYEIGELKNSLRNFTNPQKVDMDVEENNEDRREIGRLNDSGSEKFKQNEDKHIYKRRKSTMHGENENNIASNTSSKQVILPTEQNQNRWTLRYREKKPGLVELVHNSRIYVSERNLTRILSQSENSNELARGLLLAIFSHRALTTCNPFGEKRGSGGSKNVLDKKAMDILFSVVKTHALVKKWEPFNTRGVKICLRNNVANMRRKFHRDQQLKYNVMYQM